ncbi:MAG: DEAD/DEAH box helicase [Cytophagia bacterium]|nr:MAG: DEAD/DEAH box helicase [Cytophagia bacterium]TAG42962.1 MAG: DEAD/DEAH box helicase [Cytophagia bacterium]
MKVVTTQGFEVVFSIYEHEFLGYLFKSFIVQKNTKNELTYQYQSISPKNWDEFRIKINPEVLKAIELCEDIQQEQLFKKYNTNKKYTINDFFIKIYDKNAKNEYVLTKKYIENIIDEKKKEILELLKGKDVIYIEGKDGYPIWHKLIWASEDASVLFHLHRNENDSHYYPTIKYKNQKLDFQFKGETFILANKPAYMVLGNRIYFFTKNVDGKKLLPFFNKKFILVPKKLEDEYFSKFFIPLVTWFDVKAVGNALIINKNISFQTILKIQELNVVNHLFEDKNAEKEIEWHLELLFKYEEYAFIASDDYEKNPIKYEVKSEKKINQNEKGEQKEIYYFYKIKRNIKLEKEIFDVFKNLGLQFYKGKIKLSKNKAFGWLAKNWELLKEKKIDIIQPIVENKKYFLGNSELNLEIRENRDWFDIFTNIKFGEFQIPFWQLRKYILQNKTEFLLPNGETAIIPDVWLEKLTELIHFSEASEEKSEVFQLKRHHLALINELQTGEYAQVRMQRKLEQFNNFEKIDEYELPKKFKGNLRPYQKSGYNWLQFLHEYKLGGCLADDMGLGKTIMTLVHLQAIKEENNAKNMPSLLVIPTSLIYNWELEAKKFTPDLKVFVYIGQHRRKNIQYFQHFDLIITSYGIMRADVDILKEFLFHYVILDESQAIKNPSSSVSQSVRELKSLNRLILTGTPLENTTLDLWSQLTFINPGILGNQSFFKNEYQFPIEKKQDNEKRIKLAKIIKPFILRRLKSQVAADLPEKIENVQYCLMTTEQEEYYEKTKAQYRNEILRQIENEGLAKSQLLVLTGLNKLRQIANHPYLIDHDYKNSSGKLEDVMYKLENIIQEGHKVLVFSQYVKHLNLFKNLIEERRWQYAYLDGSTYKRQDEVNKFQTQDHIKIFLISLKAGGVGLNLTSAEYVFILDPWWNPAIEMQAIDRAHRIGQKNTVFTYKFITKNTVEEKILALQENKKQLVKDLITAEDGFLKALTKEDIIDLLA